VLEKKNKGFQTFDNRIAFSKNKFFADHLYLVWTRNWYLQVQDSRTDHLLMHTCTGPSRWCGLRPPTKEGQPSVWTGPQKETSSYHGGPQRTIPSAQKSQPTLLPHKKYLRVLGLSALLVEVEQQFYWVMISLWISF